MLLFHVAFVVAVDVTVAFIVVVFVAFAVALAFAVVDVVRVYPMKKR